MSESTQTALNNLRQTDNIQWYVVPMIIFVIYVYVQEIQNKNYDAFFLGIGAFFTEMIWEMFNALVYRISNFAPLWVTPDRSSFIIYIGYNLEIAVMFSIAAILLVKTLPKDKDKKIGFIPLRFLVPCVWGAICIVVEVILYEAKLLIWEYFWWRWPHIYLILIAYTAPWVLISWLYYKTSVKTKIIYACVAFGTAGTLHIILANVLKLI